MFRRLIDSLIDKWLLSTNPLYRAAREVIRRDTQNDASLGLSEYESQKYKEVQATDILKSVEEVGLAEDPVMANREKLAESVLLWARYQVLILPSENEEDVTGLRGKPGITGELKAHLRDIVKADEELKKLASSLTSERDIDQACWVLCWSSHLKAGVFQALRVPLKDCHPDPAKDWYRPFVEAMCAWEEHNYREAVGLPDVLSEQEGPLAPLKYSGFMNLVMSGAKYPNFEFQNFLRDSS